MNNFLRLYKVEQKLFFRSPDVFIFNLCMPVVVLVMIGLIAGEILGAFIPSVTAAIYYFITNEQPVWFRILLS